MLKVFAPIAWHADMPEKPCRAVMTDATRLGNEVPIAPIVLPITICEMPSAQPR